MKTMFLSSFLMCSCDAFSKGRKGHLDASFPPSFPSFLYKAAGCTGVEFKSGRILIKEMPTDGPKKTHFCSVPTINISGKDIPFPLELITGIIWEIDFCTCSSNPSSAPCSFGSE